MQNRFESRHLRTFNLVRPPFTQAVEDDIFFQEPLQIQYIDQLKHLGRFSDLILIISGEKGSGKTTLINQFLKAGNTQHLHSLVQGKFSLEKTDLLKQLLDDFNCDHKIEDFDAMFTALINHLKIYTRKITTPLLIIDDAHLLAENCWLLLKQLSHLEPHNGQCLLHVFIFTEPDGVQSFISPEIKTRIKFLKLKGMSKQNCKNYLHYRFVTVGQAGNSLFQLIFTQSVIANIHRKSHGIPGKINLLAQQRMDVYVARDVPSHTEQKIRYISIKQITIAVCGIVVLGSILLYQKDFNTFVTNSNSIKAHNNYKSEAKNSDKTQLVLANPMDTSIDQDPLTHDPEPELMPAEEVELTIEVKTGGQSEKLDNDSQKNDPDINNKSEFTSPQLPQNEQQEEEAQISSGPIETVNKLESQDFFKLFPNIKDETWLSKQMGSYFSIQIIGSNKFDVLEQFLMKYNQIEGLAYYRSVRKNETWHNIVTGVHKDLPQVRLAIRKLPSSLRKKIWIRRIRGIQADIKRTIDNEN